MTDEDRLRFWVLYERNIRSPGQRRGQARMNALCIARPDLYDEITGTAADCFYRDDRIADFEAALGL